LLKDCEKLKSDNEDLKIKLKNADSNNDLKEEFEKLKSTNEKLKITNGILKIKLKNTDSNDNSQTIDSNKKYNDLKEEFDKLK